MKKDQIHVFSYRLNCRMNMSIIEDFMGYWCFICTLKNFSAKSLLPDLIWEEIPNSYNELTSKTPVYCYA